MHKEKNGYNRGNRLAELKTYEDPERKQCGYGGFAGKEPMDALFWDTP
nr:hypothetical protein [uncultured Desulfobulbus sp.]